MFKTLKPPLGARLIPGHPLANGLVGCWLMNEGSGNKVYDLSGNGNSGTLTNGPEWKANYIKGGISLTPVHTRCSNGDYGRLSTNINGIGKAVFIGRGLSEIFGGSSMAARLYLSAMPSS